MRRQSRSLKKILALVLALCMCLALMSMTAFAVDTGPGATEADAALSALADEEMDVQKVQAEAVVVASLQYLDQAAPGYRLMVGEDVLVETASAQAVQAFGWRVDADNVKSLYSECLGDMGANNNVGTELVAGVYASAPALNYYTTLAGGGTCSPYGSVAPEGSNHHHNHCESGHLYVEGVYIGCNEGAAGSPHVWHQSAGCHAHTSTE